MFIYLTIWVLVFLFFHHLLPSLSLVSPFSCFFFPHDVEMMMIMGMIMMMMIGVIVMTVVMMMMMVVAIIRIGTF